MNSATDELLSRLSSFADAARAEQEQTYLKSERDFLGVGVPAARRIVRELLAERGVVSHDGVVAVALEWWEGPNFECRRATVEALMSRVGVLGDDDLPLIESLVRDGETWAINDGLAGDVAGRILARGVSPAAAAVLDRWSVDPDSFWVRRLSMLSLLRGLQANPAGETRALPVPPHGALIRLRSGGTAAGTIARVTDPAELARDDAVVAPRGFRSITANVGVKDGVDECSILWSDLPATGIGLFTKSLFAGASVTVSREVAAAGRGRGVVTISGNANVATGATGAEHARDLQRLAAKAAGIDPDELFVSSTGVIGRVYPPAIWGHLETLPPAHDPAGIAKVARAIMTTDTRPKCVGTTVPGSDVHIAGVAKGVGMIEPDMATLLTYFVTDADIPAAELDAIFRRVIDVTFNAVTVDGDTSTSDTALLIANGAAGPVDAAAFEITLHDLALALTKDIASDGEGATKLMEVRVTGAATVADARVAAKGVANSPLVKTAVHGADPNWGRLAMAVGKLYDHLTIHPDAVHFSFGDQQLSGSSTPADLAAAEAHMQGDVVRIGVDLGAGDAEFTAYGCDLTHGYISINADYTT